jgi:membrane fusion protein, heavy metal efflux system
MTAIRAILIAAYMTTSLQPTAGHAHEGHDDAAPPASGLPGANVPRIEAQSDLFEIVGVVQNGVMTLFVDRYATNEPIVDATIDIEAGPLKGSAQANPDGTYSFKDPALTRPGQLAVTFTIAAGRDSDLLAGDLVIADPDAAAAHANADPWWKRWWWIAGASVVLSGAVIAWWSRRKRVKGIAK